MLPARHRARHHEQAGAKPGFISRLAATLVCHPSGDRARASVPGVKPSGVTNGGLRVMRGCAGSGICWPREAGWGTPAPASQGENTNPFIFILLLIHLGCTGLMETRWRKTDTAPSGWDKLPQRKKEKKKKPNQRKKKKKFQRTLSRVGELLFGGAARRLQCAPPEAPFARHGACPIL